jgi:CHAT domain-containing protein
MNKITTLFISILLIQYCYAQDVTNLSYPEIDSLLNLHENNQEYDDGISRSLKASKKSGKQDSLCGEYLDWAAYFYELSNQKDKAIVYYNKTLTVFANTLGKNTLRYATTSTFFALFHKSMGNYDLALPLFIQAKNIREKVLGVEHPSFVTSLNNLAVLHKAMGNYDLALPLFIQAKNIREKVLGVEHPDFANSLNNLALLHSGMGNYEKALPLFIQAKNIREKVLGVGHPHFAGSLNNLALLHSGMGNYEKALPLYIQAKNIYEKVLGIKHPDFATSLNNLAGLHKAMGNYEKALPLYIQAKNIYEIVLGVEHPSFSTSLNNLASLHYTMGNYKKALPLYIQSKNIKEKILGVEHPSFATSLNNLALLHQSMENYEKGLPLYIQAKNIREKVLGLGHPHFAGSLNNLAMLHKAMGNYEKALPLYIQAKKIYEKVLGVEHPYFAMSLNNLASLHNDMGNYEKGWTALRQAIEVASSLKLSQNIRQTWADSLLRASYSSNLHLERITESLRLVYELLDEQSELRKLGPEDQRNGKDKSITESEEKQRTVADLAIQLLNKLLHQTSNEKDKLRILRQTSLWVDRSLKVLNTGEHSSNAFALVDQNKSVLLFQATKSEAAYKLGNLPDSLVWKDKKMLKKQSQLEAKLIEKRPKTEKDSLRNELNHVNQDIGSFVKMIEAAYPKYHKLKYQQVDTKVADIQALLDDHTVLIEYLISDSLIHIFKVDKNEVLWFSQPLDKEELKDNIKALHKALSNYKLVIKDKNKAYRNYTEKAHWFYQKILKPILKDKTNIQNLIIVSDGELGHLPFETFLVEPPPQSLTDYHELHYLVNDYNISYNYSATLWKENKEAPAPKNNGQILGMAANYNIKLDSSMMNVRLPTDQWLRDVLKPLPAARKEVETLQEKYQGFFAFDTLASEKMVKEKAASFAILHFATHGILDNKRPILSSLAFTEDNDSIESNFWQAHEISKIQLNADLVVLSACETGYGKFEKGNGIASLARAFMYAGASSLIVSLWQVNDYATSAIMANLYDNLANGMKKDEALRQAKIQYMKSAKGVLAHPAFWSPFIMMGKTDAVTIKTKGGGVPWAIGATLGLLVLGGGFVMRRRRKEK